ncbi:MAG: cytidylate kinase family protein [Bacteriovoracaceae bacterium]|nr:cytidylate kinase family protein [Bacteriovoracaceae bacterium]
MQKRTGPTLPLTCRQLSMINSLNLRDKNDLCKEQTKLTVTISRQYGCDVNAVAKAVQKTLEQETGQEWVIYDKKLLDKIGHHDSISKCLLRSLGDHYQVIDKIFGFFHAKPRYYKTYLALRKHAISIAKKGNAIMVGGGLSLITRNMPNCLKYQIVAPKEYRIASVARKKRILLSKASDYISQKQLMYERFATKYVGIDLNNVHESYDRSYDISKVDIDTVADDITGRVLEEINIQVSECFYSQTA